MLKKYVFALCACLLSLVSIAQNSEIIRILEEVERNNNELKAFAALMDGEQLKLKASNNLTNPQVDAYYLPYGNHSTGNYTEFQIAQSFEFPTVYGARKNLTDERIKDIELAFVAKKQQVLLTAKKYCLELIILNKKFAIEQTRVEQAKKVFEHVRVLYEKEQVAILSFNKAKIAWLQEQFSIQKIELQQQGLLVELKNLNGGNPVEIASDEFADNYTLLPVESVWQEKFLSDPYLISLQQKEIIALQEIKLSKNVSLPNLAVGYNHQGYSGEYYSGFYGGISIPLFGNKNKVKAAQANFQYQQSYSNVLTIETKTAFEKQYIEYALLLEKFNEYNQTLAGLNSDALLLEAYELGELSFMEYYLELQFYRQAFDTLLDMEKQLNLLKAELLKHQL